MIAAQPMLMIAKLVVQNFRDLPSRWSVNSRRAEMGKKQVPRTPYPHPAVVKRRWPMFESVPLIPPDAMMPTAAEAIAHAPPTITARVTRLLDQYRSRSACGGRATNV